jgi:CO/xanthine dehydrogenase FAD-binding subunit
LKPSPFEYHAPESLDEAVALLAAHGDECRPRGGGQSLVPLLSFRLARPGEGGMIVTPAAVTNAIEDALAPLGARVREQHLPPSRTLELIGTIE